MSTIPPPPRLPTEQEQAMKRQALSQLITARRDMLQAHPFIATLSMRLELVPVVDCRVETAMTDGRHIFVDAEFCTKMTPDERMYILAHETWHCAMRHFLRKGDREPERFNYATDIETDLLLQKDGFAVDLLPYDDSWDGQNAEWIYDHIPDFMVKFDNIDQHPYPQHPIPGTNSSDDNESQKESNGDDSDGKDAHPAPKDGKGTRSLRCDLPVRREDAPVFDPDLNLTIESDIGEEWQEITEAEAKAEKGRGTLPGHFNTLVDNTEKSQVDWRRELADCLTLLFKAERQWIPPNRRHVHEKLYLPSRGRRPTLEAVVAIDTSGSTAFYLKAFLAEITGIFASFGEYHITLFQCDATIQEIKEYTNDDPPKDLEHFHMRGMGGTDLRPPFEYVKQNFNEPPQVLVYLTDGMGPAPKSPPDYPVIWCLVQNGAPPAHWGKPVTINL